MLARRCLVARQNQQDRNGGDSRSWDRATVYEEAQLGSGCEVYLSYRGQGLVHFYVSRADQASALARLMEEVAMRAQGGRLLLVTNPMSGAPCLARYSDGVWYRATVSHPAPKHGHIQIYFVDYGNSEIVPASQVRATLPSLVTGLPAQAIPVRLSGCVGSIPEKVQEAFLAMVGEQRLRVVVEGVEGGLAVIQANTLPPGIRNINNELRSLIEGRYNFSA